MSLVRQRVPQSSALQGVGVPVTRALGRLKGLSSVGRLSPVGCDNKVPRPTVKSTRGPLDIFRRGSK